MPQPSTSLRVPQPCAESWDAMTPTTLGRHCAACQKTVVDFTQKTDAELWAYFAQAKGETCGRFYNDQLERPLQLAPPAAPGSRWLAWLALVLAAWSTTQAVAATPGATHPTHSSPRHAPARQRTSTLATKYVRGTVRDAATGAPLVGVAVFLRGENRMATTDSAGRFRLRLSPRRPRGGRALVVHFTGYRSVTQPLAATTRTATTLALVLTPDAAAAGAEIIGHQYRREQTYITGMMPLPGSYSLREPASPAVGRKLRKPWPWHPRAFYDWSKQQFLRPFQPKNTTN